MKKRFHFFVPIVLVACVGGQKQGPLNKGDTIRETVAFNFADTIPKEDLKQMDSLVKSWIVWDSLGLTEQDYQMLWENLITADTNAVLQWMEQNKNKFENKDGYYVSQQVVIYNYMRIELEQNRLYFGDSLMNKAFKTIESIEEELIGKKFVYRCVLQNPPPVSGPYFFLYDHTVRSYVTFLPSGDIYTGNWKKQNGKLILYFGNKRQVFRETDSMFIAETPKMRNLIKLEIK